MATIDDYFSGLDTFVPIMAEPKEPEAKKEPEEKKEKKEKQEKKRKTRKRKFEQVPSVTVGKGQPSPCDDMPPPKWDKGMLQQKKMYLCNVILYTEKSKQYINSPFPPCKRTAGYIIVMCHRCKNATSNFKAIEYEGGVVRYMIQVCTLVLHSYLTFQCFRHA